MKLTLIGLVALAAAPTAFAQTVFYGGDPLASDAQNYFATVNGIRARMVTFDDFRWNSVNPVTSVFGNFVSNQTFTRGYYEIRTGVSAGNAGTLISSGGMNVSATDLGASNLTGGAFRRYFVSGSIAPVSLSNGNLYFLSFSIDFQGNVNGQGAVLRTTGSNGIGSPLANGNLFHDQPSVGINYQARAGDVSYGLAASAVPEPLSVGAVGLGLFGLFHRRRKGKGSAS